MKDRALRRHQEFKVKLKKQKEYKSCIGDLPPSYEAKVGDNIEKLKKVCVISHYDHHSGKTSKKTLQERKHDISMREQIKM